MSIFTVSETFNVE